MAKTISSGFRTMMQSNCLTVSTCWKITRTDATVVGFTDHDQEITFDSQLYKPVGGLSRTAVRNSGDLSVDTLDVRAYFTTDLPEDELRAGLFDYATVEIYLVDFASPVTNGGMQVRQGRLGEVSFKDNQFVAELRGLAQMLSQTVVDITSPTCRADLGDTACGITIASSTQTGKAVDTVVDNAEFTTASAALKEIPGAPSTDAQDGWFDGGLVTWTSGNNNGVSMEVKSWTLSTLTLVLFQPMPFAIQVADTFDIYAGCDKTFAICQSKWDNAINFQGEPHLPGDVNILKRPDATQ